MRASSHPASLPSAIVAACVLAMLPPAARAADHRRGGSLFQEHCATCHGANGTPAMAGVPDLRRGGALVRPDRTLLLTIRNGRTTMPAYIGRLTERDMLDVIAFMRTLT